MSASVRGCREAARLCASRASRASCAPGCTAHCEPPTARVVASPLGTSVSARIGTPLGSSLSARIGGVVAVLKPAQQQSSGAAAREHTRSAIAAGRGARQVLAWHVRAATTEASCGIGSGALGGRWGGPRATATGAESSGVHGVVTRRRAGTS
eukprot:7391990-Prymnesium_polylepis.1